MNLGTMRTEVRGELQESSAAEFSNAEIDAYLNEGCLICQQLTEYLQKTSNLVCVVGQQDYTLPTDILRLQRVTFNQQFLPETTQYELDRDAGNWRSTNNADPIRHFEKQWDTLSLYPKPVDAGTAVNMAFEQAAYPAAAAQGVTSAVNWSNLSNSLLPDNAYATAGPISNISSEVITFRSFGFNLPSDATVVKIVLRVEVSATPTNGTLSATLLWDGGQWASGGSSVGEVTSTERIIEITLTPSTMPTPAQVNSDDATNGFKFTLAGTSIASGSTTYSLDSAAIAVFYTVTSSEYGELIRVEDPTYTSDPDVTVESEVGIVIAMEDSEGGQVHFLHDTYADPFELISDPELGIVIDYETDEENVGLFYAALLDTMSDDSDSPQLPSHVHPAPISYAVYRCLDREGPFQDKKTALLYFQDFADWMNSVLELQGNRWPEKAMALEPVTRGSMFERRLNEVGLGSPLLEGLRAHYE